MKFARISLVCRLVAFLILVFASTCLVAQLPAQLTVQGSALSWRFNQRH